MIHSPLAPVFSTVRVPWRIFLHLEFYFFFINTKLWLKTPPVTISSPPSVSVLPSKLALVPQKLFLRSIDPSEDSQSEHRSQTQLSNNLFGKRRETLEYPSRNFTKKLEATVRNQILWPLDLTKTTTFIDLKELGQWRRVLLDHSGGSSITTQKLQRWLQRLMYLSCGTSSYPESVRYS